MDKHTDREVLRRSYKPEIVRVLFVGESPPAGDTFFYQANSNLARYTQAAFHAAFGKVCEDGAVFLRGFAQRGCYLEDLCSEPVNH